MKEETDGGEHRRKSCRVRQTRLLSLEKAESGFLPQKALRHFPQAGQKKIVHILPIKTWTLLVEVRNTLWWKFATFLHTHLRNTRLEENRFFCERSSLLRRDTTTNVVTSSGAMTTRGQKRRRGARDSLWDLVVKCDDICFKHILPRLNGTDVKFLYGVNSETRKLIKRSSRAGDLEKGFRVYE